LQCLGKAPVGEKEEAGPIEIEALIAEDMGEGVRNHPGRMAGTVEEVRIEIEAATEALDAKVHDSALVLLPRRIVGLAQAKTEDLVPTIVDSRLPRIEVLARLLTVVGSLEKIVASLQMVAESLRMVAEFSRTQKAALSRLLKIVDSLHPRIVDSPLPRPRFHHPIIARSLLPTTVVVASCRFPRKHGSTVRSRPWELTVLGWPWCRT